MKFWTYSAISAAFVSFGSKTAVNGFSQYQIKNPEACTASGFFYGLADFIVEALFFDADRILVDDDNRIGIFVLQIVFDQFRHVMCGGQRQFSVQFQMKFEHIASAQVPGAQVVYAFGKRALHNDFFDVAADIVVERGPNIQPIPVGKAPEKDLSCKLILKVGDNITTDHIMPAGTKILPYRSNVPKLSEFCFTVCDKDFPARAKKEGGGIVVGGTNYGQGSSREHAALVPLYLGVKAVIAKSFARIHVANLINFGIVPMTFENPDDYDKISEGDELAIPGFAEAVAGADTVVLEDRTNGAKISLRLAFTPRQREILSAGGLLNYTKANGK